MEKSHGRSIMMTSRVRRLSLSVVLRRFLVGSPKPALRRSASAFLSIASLAILLVVGSPSANASTKLRTETQAYVLPALAIMPLHPTGAAVCNQGGAIEGNKGCVDFHILSSKERFLSVQVEDASGLPAPAFLAWGEDASKWIPFCGSTPKPLRVRGGTVTVWLYPYRSPNLPLCPGTASTGTVTATFLKSRSAADP